MRKEWRTLCETIYDCGYRFPDGTAIIRFGDLFNVCYIYIRFSLPFSLRFPATAIFDCYITHLSTSRNHSDPCSASVGSNVSLYPTRLIDCRSTTRSLTSAWATCWARGNTVSSPSKAKCSIRYAEQKVLFSLSLLFFPGSSINQTTRRHHRYSLNATETLCSLFCFPGRLCCSADGTTPFAARCGTFVNN